MTESMFSLAGRVAIVTGGGTGIGRGMALALAGAGADVAVAGRRPEPLESTAAEIREMGGRALAAPTDVMDTAQIARLARTVHGEFGRIDILVNNAAASRNERYKRGPLLELTEQDFDGIFTMNVKSVFLLSKDVAPIMLAQGKGVILNVGS